MDVPELSVTITAKTRWGRPVLRLNHDIRYVTERGCNFYMCVKIDQGYETDLASIPCFLWPILSPWGPWRRAAIVHDWLCENFSDRFVTDAIFRHIMSVDGVPWYTRCVIYYAVRCYWILWGQWWQWMPDRRHGGES